MKASEIDIAQNQLGQLNQYRAEYLKQFNDRKASGLMTEGESEDYQYFFASLDNSINEQQMVVGKLAA